MESSSAERNLETVFISTLAEEWFALHSTRAEDRKVMPMLDLHPEASVKTDPRMLRIIMSNLIGNAVEYAPEGSAVMVKTSGDGMVFQCRNKAPDLSAEDTGHLFERMWRKDGARTESGHAGLGLSIVKACADALGFTVSAELDTEQQLTISLYSV